MVMSDGETVFYYLSDFYRPVNKEDLTLGLHAKQSMMMHVG